jgi:hypothetical protein
VKQRPKKPKGTRFLVFFLAFTAVGLFWGSIAGLIAMAAGFAFSPVADTVTVCFALFGSAIGLWAEGSADNDQ